MLLPRIERLCIPNGDDGTRTGVRVQCGRGITFVDRILGDSKLGANEIVSKNLNFQFVYNCVNFMTSALSLLFFRRHHESPPGRLEIKDRGH